MVKAFFPVSFVLCMLLFGTYRAQAGIYSNDFSAGVGAGSIAGNAALVGGQLRLTVFGTSGQYGTLFLNDLDPGAKIRSFTATFDLTIDSHGSEAADGFSFNFANPTSYPPGSHNYELGAGSGLNYRFTTYVGNYTALGTNSWGLAVSPSFGAATMTDGSKQPVTLTYNRHTGATLMFRTNTLTVTASQLAGFSPQAGYRFLLGARCGGSTEDLYVDNLVVTTVLSGTNATLANLTLSAGALTPAFHASTTNYSLSVPLLTNSVTITPTVEDTNATVTVNGSPVVSGAPGGNLPVGGGTNVFSVVITAEDEVTIRTYTIFVVRPSIRCVAPGSASPTAPYTNWQTAAHTIQAAIDVSTDGDVVLVSNGVYSTGGRVIHEALTNRVAITNAITVQSVNGPDVTTIEGFNTVGDEGVRCVYVGANAVLSGFTLTGGATRYNGSLFTEQNGAGAWCESSGVLSNCVVYGNQALNVGGGVHGGTLYNCVLVNNVAAGGGGAYLATLNDCTIADNTATYAGGGIWNCTVNRCEVRGNLGYSYGGGSFSDSPGASVLNNCVVRGNTTGVSSGGDYQGVLNNCVVAGNSAPNGGGVQNSTVNNSIVLNNAGNPGVENHDGSTFAYSCTAPDPGGTGNIVADPLFVAPFDSPPNFHLTAGSPCLNSGNNASVVGSKDLDGRPRIANGTVDMGVFEVQAAMQVLGTNGVEIANGDVGPSPADGTSFGLAPAPTGTVTRTFAITNSGDDDLVISGVIAGGANAADFSVLEFPANVSAGAQSNLVVLFAPVSGGSRSATITIGNNDPVNSNFVFAVSGLSDLPAPVIHVLGINGAAITNGDTTANTADGTDFGFAYASTGVVTRIFAITNAGFAPLEISGISTSGPNAALFSVLSFPSIVSVGAQSNFTVRFSPASAGAKTATITVNNNDLTNFTYAFTVAGTSYVSQVRYVWTNSPSPAAPYLSWSNAAHTIQDAVDAAVDTDLILVTNGVYDSGGRVVHGAMTNRVAINKAVRVVSINGPAVTTIMGLGPVGDAAVRCAYVGTNALLSGFTLTNGATRAFGDQATEQNGGGVWCETSAIVSNCVIVGNIAPNVAGGASGGTLNRCILANNQAYGGGAAYLATLNNCLLYGNSAFGNNGGAVWACTLNNCTLSGNSAVTLAGAAYLSSLSNCIAYFNTAASEPNHSGSTITYTCTTPNPGGTGNITNDPIFVATNDFHLHATSPCIDAGNNTGVVGAIDLDGHARILDGTVDLGAYETPVSSIAVFGTNGTPITNGSITPNLTNGTDFFWCNISTSTITRTFFIANTGSGPLVVSGVTTNGDGAADFSVLSYPSSVQVGGVSNFVIRFDPSVVGVRTAVFAVANNGRATVSNYTFSVQGGGNIPATRYVATNSPAAAAPYTNWQTAARTIQDAVDWTFHSDHVVVTDGVYTAGGRATSVMPHTNRVVITNAIMIESVNGPAVTIIQGAKDPLTTNGPAAVRCVYLSTNAAATLSGFTIRGGGSGTGNVGNVSIGGGVFCNLNTKPVFTNCIITENSAALGAGGVIGGSLFNCIISSNRTMPFGSGGGAYLSILNNCTITDNRAYTAAGTYACTASNSIISGNVGVILGGGANFGTYNNCLIIGNTANYGGGLYDAVANNCTVVGNYASLYGGGTYAGTLLNTILYFNTAGLDGHNYFTFASITLAYCCTTPNPGGPGNFSDPPLFVGGSDYRLTSGSPCRDTGLNAYAPGTTELDGNPRFVNAVVDIGAYENQSVPSPDYDGDGMPNADETIAGSSAVNSNDVWKISSLTVTNPASINVATVVGSLYAVDRNDALIPNPQLWTQFTNNIPGTGGPITIYDPLPGTNRNYRVRAQLAP
jgi:Cadherin-like beta sandwich domain